MYVESITMKNFRCFEDARTTFTTPSSGAEALTAVLGDNGAGKSSVLRGIALASLSAVIEKSSGYVPQHLVRLGEADTARLTADLVLEQQDVSTVDGPTRGRGALKVIRKGSTEFLDANLVDTELWDGLFEEESPSFFLVGYGATRRVDTSDTFDPMALRKLRTVRYQRVAGLFEDHIALVPLQAWLTRQRSDRLHEVVECLNVALPPEVRYLGTGPAVASLFEFRGKPLPFDALSDGYRGFIALVGDLLYHLANASAGAKLTSLSGIVLIDELDLHLHPTWQRTVAQRLTSAFPRLQFIVTTHSPLIVGTLEREQIRVLDLEEVDGGYPRATIRVPAEDVEGLDVDDVLMSSYFGLSSTRAPEVKRRERDLVMQAAGGGEKAALELLEHLASKGRR